MNSPLSDPGLAVTRRYFLGRCAGLAPGAIALNRMLARASGAQ